MIFIKDEFEIAKMRKAGRILALVFGEVKKMVKAGVSKSEIERQAWTLIAKHKAEPSFCRVPGYNWATCLTVNSEVVHGVPGSYKLKKGDLLGIDMGVYYDGYHADRAETVVVGETEIGEIKRFLATGRKALAKAILAARAGNRVGDISKAIQKEIEKGGFLPVRSLVGHGVGKKLHEDPAIPGYFPGNVDKTDKLEAGMTLAIEVIYNKGGHKVKHKNKDGWTIVTADGSLSGLFEETVLVGKNKAEVLTNCCYRQDILI